jgi:hypothetical protein
MFDDFFLGLGFFRVLDLVLVDGVSQIGHYEVRKKCGLGFINLYIRG